MNPELVQRIGEHFNSQITSEVRSATSFITGPSAFDYHLYSSFLMPDSKQPVSDDQLFERWCEENELAYFLNSWQMLETQELSHPLATCGVRAHTAPGAIPLRIIEQYDMRHQGILYTFDLLARHVGNFHRTIINGALHREEMPFKDAPHDGLVFDYVYLPFGRLDYTCVVEENDEPVYDTLPDLDPNMVSPIYRHRYLVEGDYCYYLGETLDAVH